MILEYEPVGRNWSRNEKGARKETVRPLSMT
jgi:hypothetical protein